MNTEEIISIAVRLFAISTALFAVLSIPEIVIFSNMIGDDIYTYHSILTTLALLFIFAICFLLL